MFGFGHLLLSQQAGLQILAIVYRIKTKASDSNSLDIKYHVK